ncbi:hypothetical protein LNP18_06220 [Leuconostoc citreum]|uniref:hypothetical protein n=1 Tax=Leuconostoc citreum TaxID=33964 RepID=UPI00200A5836|nr:hypothetical protein [Leuconostoc citreum]MCK8605698.1 hypothetical protein [Leuconostoc citreum]
MTQLKDIIVDINKHFVKQKNTIYQVRVVDQPFTKKVNIFFEYYKIGEPIHSDQIARLDSQYSEKIPTIIKTIRQETGLTVLTNHKEKAHP